MTVLAQNITLNFGTVDRGARIMVLVHLIRASCVGGVVLLGIDFHARIDLKLNVRYRYQVVLYYSLMNIVLGNLCLTEPKQV